MSRPKAGNFRRPGSTENEIALQWELSRLRGELAAMRKKLGANDYGHVPGERLTGEARARFLERVGRFAQRNLEDWVPEADRCQQCGGVGREGIMDGFMAAAERIRAGEDADDLTRTAHSVTGRRAKDKAASSSGARL